MAKEKEKLNEKDELENYSYKRLTKQKKNIRFQYYNI
jgi:hypothetical protein